MAIVKTPRAPAASKSLLPLTVLLSTALFQAKQVMAPVEMRVAAAVKLNKESKLVPKMANLRVVMSS